ncbi:galactose ABC transporter substrate-binding protein [Clostridium gelidum]|uniref:D-galactose/methyl-galactoside binding periplasmic protein MglB n=1 Tax=Clostridium gelidum TaxID=704125 RepID=A0ABM7T9Y4_9CLOT|nr:galactose ABC transporter substrate-binding protein [Clostridium gelidum]BCZ48770.1 galactose ABC transporter substrate-binding protein [Clostridium gelidum]
MKMFKKILAVMIVSVIMTALIASCDQSVTSTSSRVIEGKPVKVAVLLYRFDDDYISLVRQSLEEIQKENEGKVEFTFYDGKNDQSIQNESIDTLLEKDHVDLLLVNLVETNSTRLVINKIKEKNIPVILFNREPVAIESIKSYSKSYYIGTEAEEAGVLQGKVITKAWNSNKAAVDKNNDNVLQYIMLMGESDNLEAITRTKYSVLTINNAGIETQQLALKVCNWSEEEAKDITKALFLQFGNKIEAIIANNDSMAIGAIKSLQEYGYNKGDKTPTITVVGVDAIPQAQELIKEGIMTGSVLQDPSDLAKALYTVGMNLVYNRNPLYDTEYKFDGTGVSIRLQYKEYISK